jgi:serine/threonine protein kinase
LEKWLSPVEMLEQQVNTDPAVPASLRPQLLELLVDMLQIDPRLRPSAAQLMQRPIFEDARQQEARHLRRSPATG